MSEFKRGQLVAVKDRIFENWNPAVYIKKHGKKYHCILIKEGSEFNWNYCISLELAYAWLQTLPLHLAGVTDAPQA